MATKNEIEQALVQLRRIEEHRKAGAEKEIRRLYQELLKDLKQFIGFEYAELAEDGKLTYEILQQKGEYARFLEEVELRMGNISPSVSKEIRGIVEDTYTACYTGMANAVNKASDTQELHNELQGLRAVTPETIKSVTEKGLVDEVLKKNWQESIYEIKRNIAVGLSNGDRVETMAKRISQTLDTNYKKSINIARTESHRAREAGLHDSAKNIDDTIKQGVSGLRMVKTWHTMKDSRVRPNVRYKTKSGWKTKRNRNGANHQKMEGVMVLADEYFDLGGGVKTLAPGQSGDAKNDCNCRCYLSYDLMTEEEFLKKGGKLSGKEFTSQGNSGIIKVNRIVTGHDSTPKKSEPNSVIDHVTNGQVDTRTFYNQNGMKHKDIHTTNHGNPKTHNFGENGEHVHVYEWDDIGNLKNKTTRELTEQERKENDEIL